MKKIRVLIGLVLMLIGAHPLFAETPFKTQDELGFWMTYYYTRLSPERAPEAIRFFADSPMADTNAAVPAMTFFAAVLNANHGLDQRTYASLSRQGSDRAKSFFLDVLWMTRNRASRQIAAKAHQEWGSGLWDKAKKKIRGAPRPILNVMPKVPRDLDMLWLYYFATGDERAVRKLIEVIPWTRADTREPVVLGAAAEYSVGRNLALHPAVRKIVELEMKEASEPLKQMLEALMEPKPKNVENPEEPYYENGMRLMQEQQYPEAIAAFSDAIRAEPDYTEAYFNRGTAYMAVGEAEKAFADYERTLEIDRNYYPAMVNLGNYYAEKGEYEKALQYFDRTIEIDPEYSAVYHNRAILYFYMKEYDKSWADVRKAESLGPVADPRFIQDLKKASGRDK